MMNGRKRLGVVEFGRRLIETEDLDPLYTALWGAKLPKEKLCRWLVAYWCYYHAGLCCWIVDQGRRRFWDVMATVAASSGGYPRGTERRHFRGSLAITSVGSLRHTYASAEELVGYLVAGGPSALGVCRRVLTLRGFGEWIKWKVPDMLDRLGIAKVEFVDRDVDLMFKSSKDGAKKTCEVCEIQTSDELLAAHEYLIKELGRLRAPPRYERLINVQETETIFCKWKSHLGGHYPLGKDTIELRHGLLRYARSKTAQLVLRNLPKWQSDLDG